jgi:hypothetical protein
MAHGGRLARGEWTVTDAIERLQSIQQAMAEGEPTPGEVRGFEMTVCGLLRLLAKESVLAEVDYKRVVAANRAVAKSMAEAKVLAEAQPAYQRLREAQMNHDMGLEVLRTCRSHGRSLGEEMRLQR